MTKTTSWTAFPSFEICNHSSSQAHFHRNYTSPLWSFSHFLVLVSLQLNEAKYFGTGIRLRSMQNLVRGVIFPVCRCKSSRVVSTNHFSSSWMISLVDICLARSCSFLGRYFATISTQSSPTRWIAPISSTSVCSACIARQQHSPLRGNKSQEKAVLFPQL